MIFCVGGGIAIAVIAAATAAAAGAAVTFVVCERTVHVHMMCISRRFRWKKTSYITETLSDSHHFNTMVAML